MLSSIRHSWNDKTIRIAILTVICVGFTYASTIPYFSYRALRLPWRWWVR